MSRSSLRSAGGGIYESETLRLQKEVDRFTSKLELEKRKLFIIDEQIKQVKSELDERSDVITKIKPSEFDSKKTNTKFSQTKNSVNIERVALNQTKAKNLQLRKQIDSLRKELTSAQNECKKLNKSINRTKRDATTQHTDYVNGKRLAEETNN
jgi:chromosome segregation ATPase